MSNNYLSPLDFKKIPRLDGVRAASILCVLAAHMLPLGPKSMQINSMAGVMGMSLFFALSGFLVTRFLVHDGNIGNFIARRLVRIVPAVYVYIALLIAFGLVGIENALPNLLFVSNYLTWALGEGPVSHLWSLCVEMHFYVAVALLFYVARGAALPVLLAAMVCIISFRWSGDVYANINTHLRADEILSGAILALVGSRADAVQRRVLKPGYHTVLMLAALAMWLLSCHPEGATLHPFRAIFAATIVFLVITSRISLLDYLLCNKISIYIAAISYSLYIYHPLTYFGAMNEGNFFERYFIKRPFSFAATFALAHTSTFFFEKPLTILLRRRQIIHTRT